METQYEKCPKCGKNTLSEKFTYSGNNKGIDVDVDVWICDNCLHEEAR